MQLVIRSPLPPPLSQSFNFPDDLEVAPGAKVTVWSGRHAKEHHNPPTDLYWTRRFVWNNNGDTAILVNAEGEEVSQESGVPQASVVRMTLTVFSCRRATLTLLILFVDAPSRLATRRPTVLVPAGVPEQAPAQEHPLMGAKYVDVFCSAFSGCVFRGGGL